MKLSVLDQSPMKSGVSPDECIRETLDLAKSCEAYGYHRYWLSEHHNSEALAGSAPEVLMAAIAATTSRIRLGSAGIMLPHYSAFKVAEQFRVLEAIAPGRIDLGVGRAPGADGRTALALNPNASHAADAFPAQVRDLQAWTSGAELPLDHPFRTLRAEPRGPFAPQMWILGSSNYGAQLAAWFGLPYCFAYFFSDGEGAAEALEIYRTQFRPSAVLDKPHCGIVVWAFAADTQAEADYWFRSRALIQTIRPRGRFLALPTPEEAETVELTEIEKERMEGIKARAFVGTGQETANRLRALCAELKADELVITTGVTNHEVRRNSFKLLAEAFGLGA
ncbi:LLM class flavin-dependent oxidoreductase [Acidocella aromatica]|uniref:Luciferase-like monooxygenase n=1 Tax=Acidocella aromatica TaxID=1303579 RepID=A0A840V980_9PROT|nr:LLM class flavin-dependent oxidoreductase [Acidocella aromatica]MBB5372518.1 luciferase family oxidoreductase group 1 [Acidocella aromatica]